MHVNTDFSWTGNGTEKKINNNRIIEDSGICLFKRVVDVTYTRQVTYEKERGGGGKERERKTEKEKERLTKLKF